MTLRKETELKTAYQQKMEELRRFSEDTLKHKDEADHIIAQVSF